MIKSIMIFSLAPPVGPGRLLIGLRLRQEHTRCLLKEYKLQHTNAKPEDIFFLAGRQWMAEAPDDRNQRASKFADYSIVTQPLIAPVIEEEIIHFILFHEIRFHSSDQRG